MMAIMYSTHASISDVVYMDNGVVEYSHVVVVVVFIDTDNDVVEDSHDIDDAAVMANSDDAVDIDEIVDTGRAIDVDNVAETDDTMKWLTQTLLMMVKIQTMLMLQHI